jgi:hypothetical protein
MTFDPSSSSLSNPPVPHATSPSDCAPDPALAGAFLSDFPVEPLTWLWRGRIPLGHLTLLDAAPGCGLSLFTLTVAACVSRGAPLPGDQITPPATVLLLAPYDSPSQTIRPRLEAAGADLSRILLFRPPTSDPSRSLSRSCSFPADLEALATTIRRLDARLVIIDPASAIPGLARCLPALAGLARQTNCAILLTRSLRQVPADPRRSPGPASPLLDAARSRLVLLPDPQDDHRHLLLTTRHSLCARPAILAYDLQVSETGMPALHWRGEQDEAGLTRPGTDLAASLNRAAILRFLQQRDAPCEIEEILAATLYGYEAGGYEAGRKLLQRMRQAGELVSPARGLYTTSHHPCLASFDPPAVPTVPTIPDPDAPSSCASPIPLTPDSPSSVPTVPTIPDPDAPSSCIPSIPITPDSPSFVPTVPASIPLWSVPHNLNPPSFQIPPGGYSPPDDASSVPNVPNSNPSY